MFNLLPLLFVQSQDALGKVDATCLSHQTLLELMIEGASTTAKRSINAIDAHDNFLPIDDWEGPICYPPGNVWKICWSFVDIDSVDLRWVPPTVQKLFIEKCRVKGSIDLTHLPDVLEELSIRETSVSGAVDLTKLPEALLELSLTENKLAGSISLNALPANIQTVNLSHNNFSGSVDISKLPGNLSTLDLSHNALSGSLAFGSGQKLVHFYVNNNQLTGVADLREWRCTVGEIALHKNAFEKIFVALKDSRPATYVDKKGCCPIEDGQGNAVQHRSLVRR